MLHLREKRRASLRRRGSLSSSSPTGRRRQRRWRTATPRRPCSRSTRGPRCSNEQVCLGGQRSTVSQCPRIIFQGLRKIGKLLPLLQRLGGKQLAMRVQTAGGHMQRELLAKVSALHGHQRGLSRFRGCPCTGKVR